MVWMKRNIQELPAGKKSSPCGEHPAAHGADPHRMGGQHVHMGLSASEGEQVLVLLNNSPQVQKVDLSRSTGPVQLLRNCMI